MILGSHRFIILAAVMIGAVTSAHAATSSWNVDASGNWSLSTNWSNGVPTNAGDTANLTFNITGNRIITLDTSQISSRLHWSSTMG